MAGVCEVRQKAKRSWEEVLPRRLCTVCLPELRVLARHEGRVRERIWILITWILSSQKSWILLKPAFFTVHEHDTCEMCISTHV